MWDVRSENEPPILIYEETRTTRQAKEKNGKG